MNILLSWDLPYANRRVYFLENFSLILTMCCEHCREGGVGRGNLTYQMRVGGVCMHLCVSFLETLLDWIWGRECLVPGSSARPWNRKDGWGSKVSWWGKGFRNYFSHSFECSFILKCGRRSTGPSPKDPHVLTTGTCVYVTCPKGLCGCE